MKRYIISAIISIMIFALAACTDTPKEVNKTENGYGTYYEMSDGMWMANGNLYKYRLEISGRMPNASVDSTFVYLSNIESISFEQAWKAAGISNNTEDYFDPADAVLVDCF